MADFNVSPHQPSLREGAPTIHEALDAFLSDCEIRGLSVSARRSYRIYLRDLTTFDATSCRDVLVSYVRQGKVGSARVAWAALRSFGKFGEHMGYWPASPAAALRCPKVKAPAHRYLTADQVRAVYVACQTDEQRLVVRLLLTGLRAAELLSIRWKDIADDTILIKGKGSKYRRIVIDVETARLLALTPRSGPLVFAMHYSTLQHKINRLGRAARIPFKVNPHDFRRSTFTLAIKDGMDSAHLQTLGGWSSQQMLRKYAQSAMEGAALDSARAHGMASRVLGVLDA